MYKLLRKVSVFCVTLISSVLILDYKYSPLGINTIFALLYVILVFFLSIWITFMLLQNVLSTNTPYKLQKNRLFKHVRIPINIKNIALTFKEPESIDERISNFVGDIEDICIRKWYSNYISKDEQFLLECNKLLDSVVRRYLQISGQINTDKLMQGVIILLLRHLKEYRKAVRKAKIEGSVEGHYRYAHIGSKNEKSFQAFTLQITSKTLRHFINWELYNSLACTTLQAILARKLVCNMVQYLSSPGFINYKLLTLVDPKEEYEKYRSVSIIDVDHAKINGPPKLTIKISEDTVDDDDVNSDKSPEVIKPEEITSETSTDTKPEAGKEDKVEVKVYESRSANKTWRHSSDLDCISLGQDILFLSNIAEDEAGSTKSPDWGKLAESYKAEKGIKDTIKVVKHAPPVSPSIPTTPSTTKHIGSGSVKGTMKDLQHSTTQAFHKIEDEAAGMVEGIFALAGIRKGLRLTGLQDNVLETRPKSESKDIPKTNKTRLTKLSHVNSDEDEKFMFKSQLHKRDKEEHKEGEEAIDEEEDVYMNPLNPLPFAKMEKLDPHTPMYEGDILLEKSPLVETRTSSNDSNSSNIPTMEFLHVEDSPELEYEENPDLATTTAKLRSLLAQKTEANTPIASPMSLLPTPQDASGSSIDDLSEVDGALPSMYKALSKTATGLFQNTLNSIKKTALPGNAIDDWSVHSSHPVITGKATSKTYAAGVNWSFSEEDTKDNIMGSALERFLADRQQFCVVDNAFEAVEAIDLADHIDSPFIDNERKYEEELDDFDTKIPISKAVVDLICELIEETYPPLVKENIVKTFMLVFGSAMEEQLQVLGNEVIKCISHSIGHLPKLDAPQVALALDMQEIITPLTKALKSSLGQVMDDESLSGILRLTMESVQSHKINVDTSLQLLELFMAEVIAACNQSSPTYSV